MLRWPSCRHGWFFYCSNGANFMYPLCTGLDVIAHELAHGITQILNGGLFGYGMPGAWSGECFSRLQGTVVLSTPQNDFLVMTPKFAQN